MPNFILGEMEGSRLCALEWWRVLGGPRGRYTLAEVDYALRWLRLEPTDER